MQNRPDKLAEEILKNNSARKLSVRIGIISAVIAFFVTFFTLYFSEPDPWVVLGKSVLFSLFAFFVAFYGTLFSAIIKDHDSRRERETGREAPSSGSEDSKQTEAETSQ